MKTAVLLSTLASAAAFTGSNSGARSSTALKDAKGDLVSLAEDLNPNVKFFDPLYLSDTSFYLFSNEQTIGFLRHAEVKHGRVAMAAFVGYCVQSNFHFPWAMKLDGSSFPSTDLSPPEQWASLPIEAKHQIITVIGFLEVYSELASSLTGDSYQPHYMNGGIPGKYPKFGDAIPHPVPFNLYDPFGFHKNMSCKLRHQQPSTLLFCRSCSGAPSEALRIGWETQASMVGTDSFGGTIILPCGKCHPIFQGSGGSLWCSNKYPAESSHSSDLLSTHTNRPAMLSYYTQ